MGYCYNLTQLISLQVVDGNSDLFPRCWLFQLENDDTRVSDVRCHQRPTNLNQRILDRLD